MSAHCPDDDLDTRFYTKPRAKWTVHTWVIARNQFGPLESGFRFHPLLKRFMAMVSDMEREWNPSPALQVIEWED